MPIGRWIATLHTQVNAAKASTSTTLRAPQAREQVRPGRVIHTYTGRVPVPGRILHLAWDANPAGDNVTNYNIYSGAAPGAYTTVTPAGNVTSYNLPVSTALVYLALTAENVQGESAQTAEISG